MSPRRKIPTKSELIQLQKIYKTDERIGEYLGNVPAYLVAYWRRKKNVARHSVPKFSEKEIRGLWERYGDDDKCGLELGISKAAFYNWRRRYEIREKPAFLKLEQLEFNFPGIRTSRQADTLFGKQTVTQKIIARAAGVEKVEVGQVVEAEPDLVIAGDSSEQIIEQFKNLNSEYVWNPGKIVLAATGCCSNDLSRQRPGFGSIRDFARRQGIKNYYDFRDGSSNQAILEKAHVVPGALVVGNDRRGPSFGCMNACAALVDRDSIAPSWASGKIEVTVPATVFVEVNGRRARGVFTKDIGLAMIKQLAAYGVGSKALEISGSVISQMNIGDRFGLGHQLIELDLGGIVAPFDAVTRRFLTGRTNREYLPVLTDKDAVYDGLYQINIDQLPPQIAGPGNDGTIRPVAELEGTPVDRIVLGTCSNGRFGDLRVAADVLKGRRVHADCHLIIFPASRSVYLEALKKGLIRVLVEAGAIIMNPGCSSCLESTFGSGERILTTANSRLIERDIESGSEIYVCSPATAAASAINASITEPTRYVK